MRQQVIRILAKPHQIPSRLAHKLTAISTNFFLNKKCKIKHKGKILFTMRDFGEIAKMRIVTFATKEPETLRWIDGFQTGDQLLDIGANVGIYSLYAASKGYTVAAIEPNALNFALLNLNIKDNHLGEKIIAYPYSIHAEPKISILNNALYKWGGAVSTFDRNIDWQGNAMSNIFKQGSPGITVDAFTEHAKFTPNHIKIDVDGNEWLVLKGAEKTMRHPQCRSMLVELFDQHVEYQSCLEMIKHCGFQLIEKTHSATLNHNALIADNHI